MHCIDRQVLNFQKENGVPPVNSTGVYRSPACSLAESLPTPNPQDWPVNVSSGNAGSGSVRVTRLTLPR